MSFPPAGSYSDYPLTTGECVAVSYQSGLTCPKKSFSFHVDVEERSTGNMPAAGLRLDPLDWKNIERQLQLATGEKAASGQQPEQILCCASCGKPITREDQRIAVQNRHEHVFLNPAGLIFRIGCFAAAPGCVSIGPATLEHTWFSGYRWQIALCAGCRKHLGWRYRGDTGSFYGLILNRLVSAADSANP